jgi:N6-L-threonylcarbamoyladenine synthase
VLLEEKQKGDFEVEFPVLALVVSGGHTHLFLAERVSAERVLDRTNEARGRSTLSEPKGLRSPRRRVSAPRALDRANEARGRSSEALRSPRREDADHGWKYENIGRTRDDAAGEAYDKVAKLLGLGYPGGPIIDALAKHGDPRAINFGPSQIKRPNRGTPREQQTEFDFSFSGIKTAVLRYVQAEKMSSSIETRRRAMEKLSRPKAADVLPLCDEKTLGLVASFQRAVVDDLVAKTLAAARERGARTLFVTGGVAANSELRQKFEIGAAQEGMPVYFPSRQLSTDNAAMIAAAAYPKFLAQDFAGTEFSAEASLAL